MGSEQNTNGAHHQRGGTREAVGFQCVQHLIGVLNQKSFRNRGRVLILVLSSQRQQRFRLASVRDPGRRPCGDSFAR